MGDPRGGGQTTIDFGNVELVSGEQVLERSVPQLHPVRVHGAKRHLSLTAIPGSGMSSARYSTDVDPPGPIVAPGLPEGEYEARSRGKTLRFRVPTDREITLPR